MFLNIMIIHNLTLKVAFKNPFTFKYVMGKQEQETEEPVKRLYGFKENSAFSQAFLSCCPNPQDDLEVPDELLPEELDIKCH